MISHTARTTLIVDEHPLWLDALQSLLERLELVVVGRASDRTNAIELLEEHRPDVLITDFAVISDAQTDRGGTCATLLHARELNPEVKCIVLAEAFDAVAVERAFNSGASAFCVKRADPDDLAAAIRQSFNHSIYFAPPWRNARHEVPPAATRDNTDDLTKREIEILQLAAEGHSNAQLAKMLWVTEQTVKFHLSNIYRKLDVGNRTEASRWAQRHGLLTTQTAA